MNLYTPDRGSEENYLAYTERRKAANKAAKMQRKGWKPTNFVQRGPGIWPKGQQDTLRLNEDY